MSVRLLRSLSAFVLLGLSAGCGSGDDLPREAISGTVSLDGRPLASGSIAFTPAVSSEASAASAFEAPITDGHFEVPAARGLVPGSYQVIVSSPESGQPAATPKARRPARGVADTVSGTGADDAVEAPPMRETIPSKYNTQTTLKVDVTKGGPNNFEFPLATKS